MRSLPSRNKSFGEGAKEMSINRVEACHRADNDGELAGAIDGKLMDEAWRVLK